ncbi:Maf family protein [Nesterenkonia muleiensis]|uniref:Maf family protein n=1 Tax=Nesterenkonia muleiensis TaxID=2282648 RepID=UPI001EE4D3B9|nr:Maf family protein [Nesterenkonia muleiensis]
MSRSAHTQPWPSGRSGKTPRLILASASPSRRMILQEAGIRFEVVVSEVDERAAVETAAEIGGALSPADEAELLARAKAEDVASRPEARGAVVLGCDSVFELHGVGYGKPYEVDVAFQRWLAMRGNTGVLHTGHWLVDASTATQTTAFHWLGRFADGLLGGSPQPPNGELEAASETVSSEVVFGDPTDEQIRAYVESGEPLHCAGAFTLEGGAAEFIDKVDGDREAVIGVSPAALGRLLERLGHDLTDYTE